MQKVSAFPGADMLTMQVFVIKRAANTFRFKAGLWWVRFLKATTYKSSLLYGESWVDFEESNLEAMFHWTTLGPMLVNIVIIWLWGCSDLPSLYGYIFHSKKNFWGRILREMYLPANSKHFPAWFSSLKGNQYFQQYFQDRTFAALRKAFMVLHFQTMPSAYLEGKYKRIPYAQRICVCGTRSVITQSKVVVNDIPPFKKVFQEQLKMFPLSSCFKTFNIVSHRNKHHFTN